MALNIATLADKRASLSFEFEGETINATYYPHKITPEFRVRLGQIEDAEGTSEEDRDANAQMLSMILVEWDVMAGDEPFPPTYENLMLAPQALIGRTIAEINVELGKLSAPNQSKR